MNKFLEAKTDFDNKYSTTLLLPKSLVPVNGKYLDNISLKNKNYKKVKDFLTSKLIKGQEVGSSSYIYKSHKFFIRNKSLQPESFLPIFTSDSVVPILPLVNA